MIGIIHTICIYSTGLWTHIYIIICFYLMLADEGDKGLPHLPSLSTRPYWTCLLYNLPCLFMPFSQATTVKIFFPAFLIPV